MVVSIERDPCRGTAVRWRKSDLAPTGAAGPGAGGVCPRTRLVSEQRRGTPHPMHVEPLVRLHPRHASDQREAVFTECFDSSSTHVPARVSYADDAAIGERAPPRAGISYSAVGDAGDWTGMGVGVSGGENDVAFAPAPGGRPLTFAIECRTSRTLNRGGTHDVTIQSDWSVETPHDLVAERVAMAFGGYTSCLDLLDTTVPAARGGMGLVLRRTRSPLRRDKRGDWRLAVASQVTDCCRSQAFPTAALAAEHARSSAHLARVHAAPEWQLATVIAVAEQAWRSADAAPDSSPSLHSLVRESGGVTDLWRAGIHPTELPALASAVEAVNGPLPTDYFLGAVYGNADPTWISSVLAHRPDADTAAWLAWVDRSGRPHDPRQWGAWLDLGLPRRDVLIALDAGISAASVPFAAAALDRPLRATGAAIVAWASAGCTPTPAHFRAIANHGVEYNTPSRTAIDSLVADASRAGARCLDRTELGVLLMILGTRTAVLRALYRGIRTVAELNDRDANPRTWPPPR